MDGTNNYTPELPLPEVKPLGSEKAVAETPSRVESKSGSIEGPGGQPMISAQQALVSVQAQQSTAVSLPSADPARSITTSVAADDVDVIEKEWVAKAKSIVDSTRHDPHLQSVELTKFKTEYLKYRFQKDIKATDDKR